MWREGLQQQGLGRRQHGCVRRRRLRGRRHLTRFLLVDSMCKAAFMLLHVLLLLTLSPMHLLFLSVLLLLVLAIFVTILFQCCGCEMRVLFQIVVHALLHCRCQLQLSLVKFLLLRCQLHLLQMCLRLKHRNNGACLIGGGGDRACRR